MEWYSNYRREVRVSGRGKVFNVLGMALTVHIAVLCCGKCFRYSRRVELQGRVFIM